MFSEQQYKAPVWGRNKHIQSLLATAKFRRPLVEKRAQPLLQSSEEVILECGDGVRLLGYYSPQEHTAAPLVILLHGWEGSADSMYLLSSAQKLFAAGFSVFRLNLRDHGDSHHLNEDLFHSCRLDEVIGAVKYIQQRYPAEQTFMAGYSLGGNFSLRVAANAHLHGISLNKVVAICPPIDPHDTMVQLEQGFTLYNWYFLVKWHRSLKKKAQLFPHKYNGDDLIRIKDLAKLTEVLLAEFGEFESVRHYFDAYALKGEMLSDLQTPAVMLLAKDDPIIRHQGSDLVQASQHLTIVKTEHGGHCGFLKNAKLHSWADDFLLQEFARPAT
ncbi:MAG: alpha/beta fold hydrolase [Gammaproteobacteria bacterium]|nr:alpha/beta fold hydrolase [Gammaproteobacteria bacterium]NNM13558.1 alpha/beta fold hydrolase [Gammaproteobacteria bacterium]